MHETSRAFGGAELGAHRPVLGRPHLVHVDLLAQDRLAVACGHLRRPKDARGVHPRAVGGDLLPDGLGGVEEMRVEATIWMVVED